MAKFLIARVKKSRFWIFAILWPLISSLSLRREGAWPSGDSGGADGRRGADDAGCRQGGRAAEAAGDGAGGCGNQAQQKNTKYLFQGRWCVVWCGVVSVVDSVVDIMSVQWTLTNPWTSAHSD